MESMKRKEVIASPTTLPIYMQGEPLAAGPLPAFFYFALSAEESLYQEPYNQPILFLEKFPIRCYSFTLPFHGQGYDSNQALALWMQEFATHPHSFSHFLQSCIKNIEYLIQQGFVDEERIAVGGLSRGAFIATHLAAREPRLKYVLGFAPMTKLSSLEKTNHLEKEWDLHGLIYQLVNKQFRFYIGNRDNRVGTYACFDFIHQLAEAAYQQGHRSPAIELIISASIGYKGHGTLPPIFKEGAEWVKHKLI
ncbi:Uncharacterized protein DB42_AK00960 [Neochlamydia sp. EPS4]|nr:Uncharacterized protein DB42_AK00960 [Neochlamydia sp. EPS4]